MPTGGQYANQVARGPRAGGIGVGGMRGPYGGQHRQQQNRMPGMGGQQQGMRYQVSWRIFFLSLLDVV